MNLRTARNMLREVDRLVAGHARDQARLAKLRAAIEAVLAPAAPRAGQGKAPKKRSRAQPERLRRLPPGTWFSLKEAAVRLEMAYDAARVAADRGKINSVRVGRRRFIEKSEIDQFRFAVSLRSAGKMGVSGEPNNCSVMFGHVRMTRRQKRRMIEQIDNFAQGRPAS